MIKDMPHIGDYVKFKTWYCLDPIWGRVFSIGTAFDGITKQTYDCFFVSTNRGTTDTVSLDQILDIYITEEKVEFT